MALDIRSPLYDAHSPFPCTPSTAAGDSPPGQYFTGAMVLDSKALKRHRASIRGGFGEEKQAGAPTSPETTSSISIPSPCLTSSSGNGSPDLLRSSTSSRVNTHAANCIPAHPSSASIPIILAGLGVSGSPASINSQESLVNGGSASGDGQTHHGSFGLGILQSSSKLSLPSSGESHTSSAGWNPLLISSLPDHPSSVSMSSEANLSITSNSSSGSSSTRTIEARALSRDERADSWQSDMLTVTTSTSGSGSSSAITSPEPSPRPILPGEDLSKHQVPSSVFPPRSNSLIDQDQSRAVDKPPQKERTLSSNTQFTVETYTYSPFLDDLPEETALQRWRMNSTDSHAALLPKSQGNRRSSSPLVGPPVPPKARSSLLSDPSLHRRRAVTISNPNAEALDASGDVRRRSSPPTTSASHMGGQLQGTLSSRQRAVFVSQYSMTGIRVRPSTSASQVNSNILSRSGKPLPCLPGLGSAGSPDTPTRRVGSDGYRSASMSASPAGRVWGIVSATSSDYRSLRSRDSLGSSFGESTTSPTAASFTSNSSSGGSGSKYYPPRPDSFLLIIDQESFREIRPVFIFSFYDNSTGIIEYAPKEPLATYPFHYGAIEAAPTLRRLVMPSYEDRDFLGKQATLPIKHEGVYVVAGVEGKGRWTWRFTYRISNRISLMGKAMLGEKCFVPISFCCEPQILDPAHSRKRKVFNIVYKTLVPKLEAVKIADLPPDLKPQLG